MSILFRTFAHRKEIFDRLTHRHLMKASGEQRTNPQQIEVAPDTNKGKRNDNIKQNLHA